MNRRTLLGFALLVIVSGLLPLSGCARSDARAQEPFDGSLTATDTAPSTQFSDMVNDFGVDLLMRSGAKTSGNVIVSPASVHAALSMTANGATDETARQMHGVLLSDSMTFDQANASWTSLLESLDTERGEQTLDIANAMWGRKGVAFKEPFVAKNRDSFGAQLATLDFETDDVAGVINDWASTNTHGMIKSVVDDVPDSTVLYLANAVYFKGDWDEPFTARATQKAKFTRGDGSKVDVQMMNDSRTQPYAESKILQATRLSYRGGGTAFYVLLPKKGVRLDAAVASLDSAGFSALKSTMDTETGTQVVLAMPKLDAEFKDDLSSALAEMGMPSAFDRQRAQFSGIADVNGPLWIDSVKHATKVKVDETGTEAAAATAAAIAAMGMASPAQPREIICDRPYIFAIVDESSGAMLFLGVVRDPRE